MAATVRTSQRVLGRLSSDSANSYLERATEERQRAEILRDAAELRAQLTGERGQVVLLFLAAKNTGQWFMVAWSALDRDRKFLMSLVVEMFCHGAALFGYTATDWLADPNNYEKAASVELMLEKLSPSRGHLSDSSELRAYVRSVSPIEVQGYLNTPGIASVVKEFHHGGRAD